MRTMLRTLDRIFQHAQGTIKNGVLMVSALPEDRFHDLHMVTATDVSYQPIEDEIDSSEFPLS
jgi:hypothetical protein